MALKKITEVDIIQGSSLTDSDNYYVEHNGSFYRVSKADLEEFLLGKLEHNALSVYVTDIVSGSAVYIDDGADSIPMKSLKVNIVPVQSDPSPSNVRQISGLDSVSVVKCGKNLAAPFADSTGTVYGMTYTYSNNVITLTGTTTQNNVDTPYKYLGGSEPVPIVLKSGVTYTASLKGRVNTGNKTLRLMLKNATLKKYYNSTDGVWTFTMDEDTIINQVSIRVPSSGTVLDVEAKLQIEVGSESTDFEDYVGDVYDISFSSVGTVYGGTLDVLSGELIDDGEIVDLANFSTLERSRGDVNKTVSITLPQAYIGYPDSEFRGFICSKYIHRGYTAGASDLSLPDEKEVGIYHYGNSTNRTTQTVYFVIPKNSTLSGQLVYFSAEPTAHQLVPTEIKSLLGINNIWCNAGDIDVEYRADTKLYINKKLGV